MSKDTNVSSEHNRDGPDYFGYYKCRVEKLLSQDEDFQLFTSSKALEFSGKESCQVRGENDYGASCSLFGNGVGNELSDFKRERLRTLLLQGVNVLTPEVDEMLYPVVQTREIQMHRRNRKASSSLGVAANKDGTGQSPRKKLKISPLDPQLASPTNPGSNVAHKISVNGTTGPEESKVNDDEHRQFLIDNDSPEVEEILQNVSDELSSKLAHMDQQLEELLNVVASVCRPMTVPEKNQLQKMIKELPPKNLDRVVELIAHAEKRSHDEINVDLEKESNITLWRLYYYVQAVEKARMPSL
ncbi:uncharacterized protein LOC133817176 [Humulus lupulus]|uniref:uncharacterized protein LOC133817176 n=1 Tax=Humulus lupulus TaxID=3486 RepID=UPI002B40D1FD|nr:uncharacterized protein LOC133817176 [Humulus lupulus]XP_062105579.1 uncharacterized protein LOC133817176 [Humulus lupulus]XP_062105580.1 uncharacterized protein LOC133817176 [Humulus lupulus]XP_062105582.1 uncharacterized protein LOC133817176 [Humulus lupulus]